MSWQSEGAEAARRWREEVAGLSVWWVEMRSPLERVFVEGRDWSYVLVADQGLAWTGVDGSGHPRLLPTDRPGVTCVEFAVPITTMAVERDAMAEWMRILRANGVRGRYREAGTDRWYEF